MSNSYSKKKEIFDLLGQRQVIEVFAAHHVLSKNPGRSELELSKDLMVIQFYNWLTRGLHAIDSAESPIEYTFLGSMLTYAITQKAFQVEFRTCTDDVEADIARVLRMIDLRTNLPQSFESDQRDFHEDAAHWSREYLHELRAHPDYCETFEQFLDLMVRKGRLSQCDRDDAFEAFPFFVYDHHVFCFVQPMMVCGDTRFRADMLLWQPSKPNVKIVVECDGYEYHSSPENFTKDRQRDRILYANGYHVLRYSGSEIFSDPKTVIHDVHKQMILVSLRAA